MGEFITTTYDYIIVGAGPAGLKCAEVLGSAGKKVLLVEKNAVIGPKVCAGGLTGKDLDYLEVPEKLIEYRFDEVDVFVRGYKRKVKDSVTFAYTIDRHQFGQWQLSKLNRTPNVEVRTNSKVKQITADYVEIGDQKIAYKVLIGADGSNSLVRRYLGLGSDSKDLAFHYIIPQTGYKNLEFHFASEKFAAWYAWVFPHRDYVSVGCAADPQWMTASELKINFRQWLKERGIKTDNAHFEGFPIAYDYKGMQFGNIWLLGDAAGLASGFTGEGIYQAVVSGAEAAQLILNPNYKSEKLERVLSLKHKHNRLLKMLLRAGRFRDLIFLLGWFLFLFPAFTRKMIRVLG